MLHDLVGKLDNAVDGPKIGKVRHWTRDVSLRVEGRVAAGGARGRDHPRGARVRWTHRHLGRDVGCGRITPSLWLSFSLRGASSS